MSANTCPHCGTTFAHSAALRQHERTCLQRPGIEERVRAALENPDAPGVALSVRQYVARTAEYAAPTADTLRRAWGDWPTVCARVGLEPGQRSGPKKGVRRTQAQCEVRAIAEVDAALEDDAALREYWDGGRGLPVLDTPRRLADGRVAWMCR